MSDDSTLLPPDSKPSEANATRRRFLRGGAAAAPVLMTLASRPVLGAQVCTTASAFGSMGSGRTAQVVCSGRAPEYWANEQSFPSWPAPYTAAAVKADPLAGRDARTPTLFQSCFAGSMQYQNKTLLDVLHTGGGSPNDVARHCVAAMLNVAAGLAPVLTIPKVCGMWQEFSTRGYYEPTAGVRWDNTRLVAYLRSTMPN
jgi:hypothetical protein